MKMSCRSRERVTGSWIGDHAVDFLVDSGSAVTAVFLLQSSGGGWGAGG